ncbi:MAG TPA: hypothetical protein VGM05_25300 [Planctomycetaceae bacterium]
MSVLGPGSMPNLGLAGALSAGQLRAPDLGDRDKADQSIQKLKSDQFRLANRDLDDSIETDFSHGQVGDRDSDGRLPGQAPGEEPSQEEAGAEPTAPPRVAGLKSGCGGFLDVDA